MKHSLFHRWMIRAALAATLALVLVPTVGRLIGQGPVPGDHAALSSAGPGTVDEVMSATMGRTVTHAGSHSSESHADETHHAAAASGGGHHGSDEDCAYCPLLLGTTSLPVPRLQIPLPLRSVAVEIPEIRAALLDRHPTGLGSRGPPLAG